MTTDKTQYMIDAVANTEARRQLTIAEEMDIEPETLEESLDRYGLTRDRYAQEMVELLSDPKTPPSVRLQSIQELARIRQWYAPEQHDYRFRPGEIEEIMATADSRADKARGGGGQGDGDDSI